MIDWVVYKQLTISISITEAELLTLLYIEKEILQWINHFNKLNLDLDYLVTIYNNNLQILQILISESLKLNIYLRHNNIYQSQLRQVIQIIYLNIDYLLTTKIVADSLTKLLPAQKHQTFIKQLGLIDLEDLIDKLQFKEKEI